MRRAISTDADEPVEQRHGASHFARMTRVLSYERRDLNARSLKDWQHRIQSRQASTSATVWVHDEVHAPRLERSSRKNQQRLQEGSANCKHLLAAARPSLQLVLQLALQLALSDSRERKLGDEGGVGRYLSQDSARLFVNREEIIAVKHAPGPALTQTAGPAKAEPPGAEGYQDP